MIDNTIRTAGKRPNAVEHDVIHFFSFVPLLQFDDDNITAPTSICASYHKVYTL